jgi:hypothetical protein
VSKTITLATGQITAADQLSVQLVQALETPPAILIRWPGAPSVTDPRKFGAVANAAVAILAEARARLATMKAGEMHPPNAPAKPPSGRLACSGTTWTAHHRLQVDRVPALAA